MSIFRRRLMQLIKKKEDTQLKCLISTGTQYIDTGIIPTSNTRVEMDFEVTRIATEFYFGSRTSTSAQDNYSFLQNVSKLRSDYGLALEKDEIVNVNQMTGYPRFHVVKDKNITRINDVTITRPEAEFQGKYSLYIFGVNNAKWATSFSQMKLYTLKIYESDVLIRDYIPMLDENSNPYLFDKITKEKYYNQGSGEFEYEELNLVKCLASSRQWTYTKSDYALSSNCMVEVEFEYNSLVQGFVFGGRTAYGENDGFVLYNTANTNSLVLIWGNQTISIGEVDCLNSKVKMKIEKGKIYLNDQLIQIFNAMDFTGNICTGIFGIRNGDNGDQRTLQGKIYSFKIYEDNSLVRYFRPALDEKGVACFYEELTATYFYTSSQNWYYNYET